MIPKLLVVLCCNSYKSLLREARIEVNIHSRKVVGCYDFIISPGCERKYHNVYRVNKIKVWKWVNRDCRLLNNLSVLFTLCCWFLHKYMYSKVHTNQHIVKCINKSAVSLAITETLNQNQSLSWNKSCNVDTVNFIRTHLQTHSQMNKHTITLFGQWERWWQ